MTTKSSIEQTMTGHHLVPKPVIQLDIFGGFTEIKTARRVTPKGSTHKTPAVRKAIIDNLAERCIKGQSPEWWSLCIEVAIALMTHIQHVPGSYLTACVRALAKQRGIHGEPTTHNAWNSAIRMLMSEFGEPICRVQAVTPQTHDKSVVLWKSSIYRQKAEPPEWFTSIIRPLV